MCKQNVVDKEVSNEGLYKTEYDLRVDRNNFKREQAKIEHIAKTKDATIKSTTNIKSMKVSKQDLNIRNLLNTFNL